MNLKWGFTFFMMMWLGLISAASAFSWDDLWETKDQQAKMLMDRGQFKEATDTFEREDWQATAAYRAKDYKQAATIYQSINNETADYNQGNALAHMGQYAEAINAYNKSLALNPRDQDALYNRKIVEELLKKQKQDQQKQDQQKQDQQKQDQQKQDQQKQDQQKQDQQKQDQQKQDQQKQDQQKQDQPAQGDAKQRNLREKQQAKEQWLNLIPDDPGGLLREKFLRDHLRRQPMWDQ